MSDVLCVFLIILSVIMIVFLLKNKNNPKYINKDYDSYYKNSSLAMKDDLDNEKESIKRYSQGNALFVCGSRRMQINVVLTPEELESFGSGGGL